MIITTDCVPSLKTIAQEITGNIHDDCQSKGLLIAWNLTVKYIILYKIGVANCTLSIHGLWITHGLDNLFYQIRTMTIFNFGEYVFEQVVRHIEFIV